jgi:hypothetical protein
MIGRRRTGGFPAIDRAKRTIAWSDPFRTHRQAAAIRLSNGGLFIWSPIALSETLKREIDALGPVCCLVSPNQIHHLFLAARRALRCGAYWPGRSSAC